MPISKNKLQRIKKGFLPAASIFLLMLAVLLLCYNLTGDGEALGALTAQIYFEGEYRIGDGPWQEVIEAEHISASKGDVTLRGNFHCLNPEGKYDGLFGREVPLALYTDHINVTICENGAEPYVIDNENPLAGVAGCSASWTAYHFTSEPSEPVELIIHNPHRFGNETAVDALLDGFAIWGSTEFEQGIMKSGAAQRNVGLLLMITALILFGIALFAALLNLPNIRMVWLFGGTIFFAGLYLVYSAKGVSFWSRSVIANTTLHGISMMFYLFFLSTTFVYFLQKNKKIGILTVLALGIVDGICLVLPIVTGVLFYDTLLFWAIAQTAANLVLLAALARELRDASRTGRCILAGLALPFPAFEADAIATLFGIWENGVISKCVFAILFLNALFVVLRLIPDQINAAARAKELELQRSRLEAEKSRIEAELKESRIAIMLSQIQPHFIYNTLGTIERMCLKDPRKAFTMVRNFSLYLRGNFSELDNVMPIPFTKEMEHVTHYINIEKVRFPDICITYELEAEEFSLPALSVQPLVENAIKHGIMPLETGGGIRIHSYETPSHFCVSVTDDGVGFDPQLPIDEKKHIGIRNIRGRLKEIANGMLVIESSPGSGTKAVIMIPKEASA